MLRLLFILLTGLVLFLINRLIIKSINRNKTDCKKARCWLIYSIIFSLLFSFLSFWKIDFLSIGVGNELDLMNEFSSVNNYFHTSQTEEYRKCYMDNFLFIDVNGNYKIIDDINEKVVISDRKELAALFDTLARNISRIDMVVMDMFIDKKDNDSSDIMLREAIRPFYDQHKIVMAQTDSSDLFSNDF